MLIEMKLLVLLIVNMFAYSLEQTQMLCIKPCICTQTNDPRRMDMNCSNLLNGTQMPYGAFSYNQLDLSLNKFKILNVSKIDAYILKLDKNSIEIIYANSFDKSAIRKLYINENLLTKIEPNAFIKLSNNLTDLDLSSNKLEVLPSFKNLTKLERVNLKYNRIRDIFDSTNNCGVFPSSILNIDLKNNELVSIESFMFDGLNQLSVLDLGKNRIETVQAGSFKLPRLKSLDLSENYLSSFEHRTFYGIDECYIDLSAQHKKVSINSYTFDTNNGSLLTFNMNNNKFLFDSSSPLCITKPNSSDISTKYYLNNVDITNVNPCFLVQFVDAIQESEIRLINTELMNCDCDVINYFQSLNKNCRLKCSDTGLSLYECVGNLNMPTTRDICSNHYDKCFRNNSHSSMVSKKKSHTTLLIITVAVVSLVVLIGVIVLVTYIIIRKRKPTRVIKVVAVKVENLDDNNYCQPIVTDDSNIYVQYIND